MEPHDRGPSPGPRLQNRSEETGHNDSVHCEQHPGSGMLKPTAICPPCSGGLNLTSTQSIRAQQSEKRNLAEQAFALSRRQEDWVSVSESMDVYYYILF